MNSLVAYGSSDEEDDVQPEKPAKIAKTEPVENVDTREDSTTTNPIESKNDLLPILTPNPPRPNEEIPPPPGPTAGPAPLPSVPSAPSPHHDDDNLPQSPYSYERLRLRSLTMPTNPNFTIPPSPPPPEPNSESAATLAATTKKFETFLHLKRTKNVHFNSRLAASSSLRNPALLPKLMEFAGMDLSRGENCASSLPEGCAVPTLWPEECYVERLVGGMERREKKRTAAGATAGRKREFVPASSPSNSSKVEG